MFACRPRAAGRGGGGGGVGPDHAHGAQVPVLRGPAQQEEPPRPRQRVDGGPHQPPAPQCPQQAAHGAPVPRQQLPGEWTGVAFKLCARDF